MVYSRISDITSTSEDRGKIPMETIKNILKKTLYKITLRAILIFILVLSEENNADYYLFQKSNLEMEVMQLRLYRRL